MKRPVPSLWSSAIDQLAHARGLNWALGAATGAAWDAVHTGEEALLAAAPSLPIVGEKLRYLLAIIQPFDAAGSRQQQPWRHRLLRSAIEDLDHLGTALAAAQAEARRPHKGAGRRVRPMPEIARLRGQLAECQAELEEAAAMRDAALDALGRANRVHALASLSLTHAGPFAPEMNAQNERR